MFHGLSGCVLYVTFDNAGACLDEAGCKCADLGRAWSLVLELVSDKVASLSVYLVVTTPWMTWEFSQVSMYVRYHGLHCDTP